MNIIKISMLENAITKPIILYTEYTLIKINSKNMSLGERKSPGGIDRMYFLYSIEIICQSGFFFQLREDINRCSPLFNYEVK